MNKYVLVTSFNEEGYKKYGRRMLDSMAKYWSEDIDIRVWYHDFDLTQESLPEADHISYHNLNDVPDLISFRERLNDYEPKNCGSTVIQSRLRTWTLTG